MLRDKNLIPLSHQHQRALALCVRVDRASPIAESDLPAWQAEIAQHFQNEIRVHFAAEETVLFSQARRFRELEPLVEGLLADHAVLRQHFTRAEKSELSAADLRDFAQCLSAHIRREERELFERLQKLMTPDELAELGRTLEEALKDSTYVCALPTKSAQAKNPPRT